MSQTNRPDPSALPADPLSPPHAPGGSGEADVSSLDVCRKLRTKLAFTPLVDSAGEQLLWQRGDGSTAVYWCLSTMECAGPDGGLAHATLCRGDRACYKTRA
jgi:hypothetical protein